MFWTCCKLVPSPTKFSSQQTALQELAEFWSHEKDTLWYRSHPVFKDSVIFSWRLCDSETLSSYLIGPVPTLSRRMTHLMCYLFVSSEMAPRVRAAWIHNGSGNNLQDECAKNTIKLSHAVYQYTHDLKRWILNTCIGIEMPSNHDMPGWCHWHFTQLNRPPTRKAKIRTHQFGPGHAVAQWTRESCCSAYMAMASSGSLKVFMLCIILSCIVFSNVLAGTTKAVMYECYVPQPRITPEDSGNYFVELFSSMQLRFICCKLHWDSSCSSLVTFKWILHNQSETLLPHL